MAFASFPTRRSIAAPLAGVVTAASLLPLTLLLTIGSLPLPTRHNCTG
jgi:hypothetical protein